jgi:nicotinamide mononucleotide transporter
MNETLSLLGLSTTPLELLSFVLSIATVWLNIRQNHWAWLFAILSSALYGAVFYQSKLYGDMGLQAVFITVSFWGWYQWLHGDDSHARLSVTALSWPGRAVAALGWIVAFIALAWFLMAFTDTDVPFADGFLTAGSLVGQLLLSRKKLENWHVWIIVDVLYVALYVHKGLVLTAVLYGLFVVMAAIGLLAWRKSMLADAAGDVPASEAMVLR